MNIIQDLLPINFAKGRKGPFLPDTIVIHVTEGDAKSVRSWFHDPAAQVSAHYMVQKDGEIVQFVRETDTAWANGRVDHPTAQVVLDRSGANPNWWTISIEHEGDGKHELTDPQRASSLWLMRDIQTRNRRIIFDAQHVLPHHAIYSLKPCPGAIDVNRLIHELNNPPDFSDVSSGSNSTAPS